LKKSVFITTLFILFFAKCFAQDSVSILISESKKIFNSGDRQKSYIIAYKALKIAERLKQPKQLMYANLQVGVAEYYYNLRNKEIILPYFYRALKIAQQNNFDSIKGPLYHNIGAMYTEMGQIDSAIIYMKNCVQTYDSTKQFYEISQAHSIMAEICFIDSNRTKSPLSYINKAYRYALLSKDSNAIAFSLMKYGLYYFIEKQIQKALPYFNRAEKIYENRFDEQGLFYVYGLKKDCYGKLIDPDAEKAYSNYIKMKDSLFKKESIKELTHYQTIYQTEKKERENIELHQENELKHQQLKGRNTTIIALTIVLLLIIVIILWRQNVINLKEKQKELEAIKKIEHERNRISRDLHDNVGSLVSFVNTKIDWILKNKEINSDLSKDLTLVKNNAKDILDGLRDSIWVLNSKSITNFELVDKLKPYIKNHLLLPFNINDELLDEQELSNDVVLAIYRSCQEVINNINKHSQATKVSIHFFCTEKIKLGIKIWDNGIGIKETDLQKENHYGIRNLKSRLLEVNATFEITTEELGTTIKISI
jgi:signal transduction histidine kinase